MGDYRSNSNKLRDEEHDESKKKVEKIVTGKVKSKKKNEIKKLTDVFAAEDVGSVKSFLMTDVVIPAVKDLLEDLVSKGIRMILRGDTNTSSRNSSPLSRISYNRSYKESERRPNGYTTSKYGYDFFDIILDNRGEAEDVLCRMEELIDRYELVSVADLYDLVGVSGNYTDNKYGWTNLRSADVIRVRDGYLIKLPKALPLD